MTAAELAARLEQVERLLGESSAVLDTVLVSSPAGIAIWDRDLRYVRVNETYAAMNGRTVDQHLGRPVREVLPELESALRKVLEEGRPLRGVEDGGGMPAVERRSFVGTYHPLRRPDTQEIFGVAAVLVDTAHARTRLIAHRIEETVRQRTAELAAANQELETFSYSVSHDLRAPLRAVDGFAQALLEDHGASLPPDAREHLDEIRRAAERMAQLIDDLLQLSRVTRTPLRVADVDLSALARRVAETLAREHPERSVAMHVEEGVHAPGDEHLLRIVFENLLSNAWKFTSRVAAPEVWFGTTMHEGHPAFFVRDNGVGFDMRYAGRLFAAFQRLHTQKEFPGTGIGLATVQRIVRRHGGRAWALSSPGAGTTIFFALD